MYGSENLHLFSIREGVKKIDFLGGHDPIRGGGQPLKKSIFSVQDIQHAPKTLLNFDFFSVLSPLPYNMKGKSWGNSITDTNIDTSIIFQYLHTRF